MPMCKIVKFFPNENGWNEGKTVDITNPEILIKQGFVKLSAKKESEPKVSVKKDSKPKASVKKDLKPKTNIKKKIKNIFKKKK